MTKLYSLLLVCLCLVFSSPTYVFGVTYTSTTATFNVIWDNPTVNDDGSPLTDLSTSRIYTKESGVYSNYLTIFWNGAISQNTLVTYSLLNDEEKIIYIVITAINNSGDSSINSNEVSIRVDKLSPSSPK